jgi:hypothetical protein
MSACPSNQPSPLHSGRTVCDEYKFVREDDFLFERLSKIKFCPRCGARTQVYDEDRGHDAASGKRRTKLNARCTFLDGKSFLRILACTLAGCERHCRQAIDHEVWVKIGFRKE